MTTTDGSITRRGSVVRVESGLFGPCEVDVAPGQNIGLHDAAARFAADLRDMVGPGHGLGAALVRLGSGFTIPEAALVVVGASESANALHPWSDGEARMVRGAAEILRIL